MCLLPSIMNVPALPAPWSLECKLRFDVNCVLHRFGRECVKQDKNLDLLAVIVAGVCMCLFGS